MGQGAQTDFEDVVLSETSQSPKENHRMIPFIQDC